MKGTYNANGGTGAPDSQTKKHDVSLKLSSTKPYRMGYAFLNWNTSITGTGTTYKPGATYTLNKNLDLYAQWEANSYNITYDLTGGSFEHTKNSTYTNASGAEYIQNPTTAKYDENFFYVEFPIREGYMFNGSLSE